MGLYLLITQLIFLLLKDRLLFLFIHCFAPIVLTSKFLLINQTVSGEFLGKQRF